MKKNVLLWTDKIRIGGAEKYFYQIENYIDSSKINLITISTGKPINSIKYKDKYFNLPRFFIKRLFFINNIIESYHIQIFHANSLRTVTQGIIIKYYFKHNYKIIYTRHNKTLLDKVPIIMSFILNKLIYKTIVICKNEKNKLIKLFNCKEGKIKIIYNGVDVNYFMLKDIFPENKTKKVGILARLSSGKNHDFFLKMAIEIIKKNNNIEFYIAGDGPRMKKLEYQIEKIKVKNIHILGNISNVKEFLQEMDITCLVSKREVLPMSILESMSVGTPVVSINVGGINEIINLENGWIIDSLDLEIFSKTIINIFNNYSELIKKSLFSRETIKRKFSLEKMISNIEKIYLD